MQIEPRGRCSTEDQRDRGVEWRPRAAARRPPPRRPARLRHAMKRCPSARRPGMATKSAPGVTSRESDAIAPISSPVADEGSAASIPACSEQSRQVGAPYASDAPSQSMVGSLRSWLERSRSERQRAGLARGRTGRDTSGAASGPGARGPARGDRTHDPRRHGSGRAAVERSRQALAAVQGRAAPARRKRPVGRPRKAATASAGQAPVGRPRKSAAARHPPSDRSAGLARRHGAGTPRSDRSEAEDASAHDRTAPRRANGRRPVGRPPKA